MKIQLSAGRTPPPKGPLGGLGSRLSKIERYRPKRRPYRSYKVFGPLSVGAWPLTDYGEEICAHVAAKGQITLDESYYLYFLARILARGGASDVAGHLDRVSAEAKISDAEPLHLGSATSETAIPSGRRVIRANWRFLPDPENMSAERLLHVLREHFSEHTGRGIALELKRIKFALGLKPIQICVGLDEFWGYYAFLFPRDIVLFECPVYGNAAYVVKGDWRVLSRKHKAQLERKGERIIHCRHWSLAIKGALKRCRK